MQWQWPVSVHRVLIGKYLLIVLCNQAFVFPVEVEVPGKEKEVSSCVGILTLAAVGYSKGYSKALEYEYRVKTAALGTLKRYSIFSLTLYLEWYNAYSIVGNSGPH
jgi:hypothetical protein